MVPIFCAGRPFLACSLFPDREFRWPAPCYFRHAFRRFRDKHEAMKPGLRCNAITACFVAFLGTFPCRGGLDNQFQGLLSSKLSPYGKAWKPQGFSVISKDQAAQIGIEVGKDQRAFIG